MAQINLFGLGMEAKSPYVTCKTLTNMYVEQRPQGEKSQLVAYGTPGLELFASFGAPPVRGGIEVQSLNLAFVVHRGTFYEVNNAGTTTVRGAIGTTSGRVCMAHNGVQVMIVDGALGYIYNTSTHVFAQIVDADFPANPTTVCCLARVFVVSVSNSSRFYWSDVDNGLAWDALDFANAEAGYDPIVAVYESNGQLNLLGQATCEFWGISGVADPRFTPLQGSATEWGLAARFSIAKYDNSYMCLMTNRTGQVMVAAMAGYLPSKKSTVDLDSLINDVTNYPTTSDATAYSYMLGGHPMYVITFPTAGKSWLFDGSTGFWSPLKSFGITRHLSEFSFQLGGRTIVADYDAGRLYVLTAKALTDNGASIEREIVGETIAGPYEGWMDMSCLRLDCETGVGLTSGQGSNPQIALSLSRDNGKTWGPDMWKTLGAIGEYATRVEWRRLGSPRYLTPKIRLTDPVPLVIVRACVNPET